MKLITFEDKDARALLETLELEKHKGPQQLRVMRMGIGDHEGEYIQLTEREIASVMAEVHSRFHYHVVRWLQEQGASTLR